MSVGEEIENALEAKGISTKYLSLITRIPLSDIEDLILDNVEPNEFMKINLLPILGISIDGQSLSHRRMMPKELRPNDCSYDIYFEFLEVLYFFGPSSAFQLMLMQVIFTSFSEITPEMQSMKENVERNRDKVIMERLKYRNKEYEKEVSYIRKSKKKISKEKKRKFIYFAQTGRFVKVGTSVSPKSRISAIKKSCPKGLNLLLAVPGSFKEESYIHKRFAHICKDGEWFYKTKELTEYMDRCRKSNSIIKENFDEKKVDKTLFDEMEVSEK